MAEIHVQAKKNKTMPVWVWIVAAVLILGAIAYALLRNKRTDQTNTGKPNPTSFVEPRVNQALLC
ncbi:MAG TPA: hypothetical protein VFP87_05020 [Chitinophagaceae bacterium]|nr:hypothetical protein [Chitinophagaceae bacterium]